MVRRTESVCREALNCQAQEKRTSREFVCCYLFHSSKREMEEGGHFGQFPEKVSKLALSYKLVGSTTCLLAFSIVIVQDGLPTV